MRPGGKAATATVTTKTRTFSSVAQAFSPARIVANEVQGQVGVGEDGREHSVGSGRARQSKWYDNRPEAYAIHDN